MTAAPAYDPGVHTAEDNPVVLLEMWCRCGGVHRQLDPVSHCLPQIADFQARHFGEGHGPADPKTALTEREERRRYALAAEGKPYEPMELADVADATAFDWRAGTETV